MRRFNLLTPAEWVGLDNYVRMVNDPIFWDSLAVTVALTPEDAQRFVFSMENGSTWFGLLPPDAEGETMKPIGIAQVVE